MNANDKCYPLIPEEERKCVWMTTGLISYKLCERNFQCEFCPFDQAIKNGGSREDDSMESGNGSTEGSLNVDPSSQISGSFFYHPDHCWLKVESAEKVRIGIDDLLTQLMTNIQVIILPQVESLIGQGECCAHIIQEDHILPVVSPVSGSVQTTNPRLKKKPELITDDPRGYGWLLTVRPGNLQSDLKNLLFGKKAHLWYRQEEKEILARADLILKQSPRTLGPTMQDGGVRITRLWDILNVLTAKQRAQILDLSIARRRTTQRSTSNTPSKPSPAGK